MSYDEANMAQLRKGMTYEELVAVVGEPKSVRTQPDDSIRIMYFAPIGARTVENEGYIGFEVHLVDRKVTDWRVMRDNPSYEPGLHVREHLRWPLWFWGALFFGGVLYATARSTQRAADEQTAILEAFRSRSIPTSKLPIEFRFISHDTTLSEVVERAGPVSRRTRILLSPESLPGYTLPETEDGQPFLPALEYDLPYASAVLVIGQAPFTDEERVHAVYFRPPRDDTEP